MAILDRRKPAESSGSETKTLSTKHPFLTGNFAPVHQTSPLTSCKFSGSIPEELTGGQYVRNGSNPVSNEDLGRDAHWFDGDGMLSGVLFKRTNSSDSSCTPVQPEFVCQYILTDLYLSATATQSLRRPIAPSISTLVNPLVSIFQLTWAILRSLLLVLLSHLPGSKHAIKRISVANTSIIYHDGRALATCESGPPMRIALPRLETVGWFDGNYSEGEFAPQAGKKETAFGGSGFLSFMREWTTAHPKVDPSNGDLILFHSTFAPPYVQYSVIPAVRLERLQTSPRPKILNLPVPGIKSPKMMHDFGVSAQHTIIMDLPLSLDPLMSLRGKPPVTYDPAKPARFGIFPRHQPSGVKWFQTSACCIFHTANTWDVLDERSQIQSVDMLACRMTSASVVFSAGNIPVPQHKKSVATAEDSSVNCRPRRKSGTQSTTYGRGPYLEESKANETSPLISRGTQSQGKPNVEEISGEFEEHQCRLYYFSFDMTDGDNCQILHQFALSAIPFEFPSVRDDKHMSDTQYIFGCSTTSGSFNPALGKTSKIDALVKFNAQDLIEQGKRMRIKTVAGCVDTRSVVDILESSDESDSIQIFKTPANVCAQEPRFVPAANQPSEDSGYLLSYMFDESQLDLNGEAPPSAVSELWIIDAKSMKDVLAVVALPQRVPYGFHGNWFSAQQVENQWPILKLRQSANEQDAKNPRRDSRYVRVSRRLSNALMRAIGG